MKVTVPIGCNVNMKLVYSKVKPLIPKKEFLKEVRDVVKQFIEERYDGSIDTRNFCLDNMIDLLVDQGYAEFIESWIEI